MSIVHILPEFHKVIRKKFWDTIKVGLPTTNYRPVARKLLDQFGLTQFKKGKPKSLDKEDVLNFVIGKVKSFLYNFKGVEVETNNSESYYIFIMICKMLGVDVNWKITESPVAYEYSLNIYEVIEQLIRKHIIEEPLAKKQIEKLEVAGKDDIADHYTCFFSRGRSEPEARDLTIYFKKGTAALSSAEGTLNGTFTTEDGHLFILLNDPDNHYRSFLYLKRLNDKPVEISSSFAGSYNGPPPEGLELSAVKVIATKKSEAVTTIAPRTVYELYEQAITVHKRMPFRHIHDFHGNYQGYYFEVTNQVKVVRIILEVEPDGRTRILGSNDVVLCGEIVDFNSGAQMLKLAFRFYEQNNASFHITLDASTMNDRYMDGVYSGHRNKFDIFSGRFRIYQCTSEQLKEPEVIPHSELFTKEPMIGQNLENYFLGKNQGQRSSKFLQPNFHTFDRWFNPSAIKNTGDIARFNKPDYVILRLASEKTHINRYHVKITDGIVAMTLEAKETKVYSGTASFIQTCLMLNLNSRKKEPYDALYIFNVGAKRTDKLTEFNGVYATLTYSSNPICGRAILMEADENTKYSPITLFSDEYYAFNKDYDNMLDLLTGTENNTIKVNRHEDNFTRSIPYGDVFFVNACAVDDLELKSKFLKLALDQGFRDGTRLRLAKTKDLKKISLQFDIDTDEWDPTKEKVELRYKDKKGKPLKAFYSWPLAPGPAKV